ncbi:MAG: SDR family oxidoreductase [Vicinamibacterales bacterium]
MGSNVAYCASKAALDNMTKSLGARTGAEDQGGLGAAGLVDTEFVKSLDTKWRDEQAERTALKRLAMPDEIGAAVIAVTQLTFSTGLGCRTLAVDGGRPLN